jgi:molybdate transport system ATP-binding protein
MIEVEIERRFPGFQLAATFASEAGVTALFGPSGSGKTMIADAIAGLTRPDRGRIVVDGRVLFDSAAGVDVAPEKRRIGYVFQEDRLFPHLSVRANLRYGMNLRPAAERTVEFDRTVDLLGLRHLLARLPHRLSGGEKQRVALGRALLTSPRLLLMDEPLANLDDARRSEILSYIEEVRRALSVPVVYVSHALDEISRLADDVAVVAAGRVVACGPVAEIMTTLDIPEIAGRRDAGAVLTVRVREHDVADGLSVLDFAGGHFIVPNVNAPVGAELRLRIQARDVSIALTAPTHISTLNILKGTIREIGAEAGPQANVLIDVGGIIAARLTRRSVRELALAPGREVYVLIKSVAVER